QATMYPIKEFGLAHSPDQMFSQVMRQQTLLVPGKAKIARFESLYQFGCHDLAVTQGARYSVPTQRLYTRSVPRQQHTRHGNLRLRVEPAPRVAHQLVVFQAAPLPGEVSLEEVLEVGHAPFGQHPAVENP